jgi:CheY-like chemotaxis protein
MLVDDEDFLFVCKEFLETREPKFIIDAFTSTTEALKILSESPYDIIVSNYQMPGMNGIELLICARSLGITAPFILFTGRSRFDFLPPEALVRESTTNFLLKLENVYYLLKAGYPETQYVLSKAISYILNLNGRKKSLWKGKESGAMEFASLKNWTLGEFVRNESF